MANREWVIQWTEYTDFSFKDEGAKLYVGDADEVYKQLERERRKRNSEGLHMYGATYEWHNIGPDDGYPNTAKSRDEAVALVHEYNGKHQGEVTLT